MYPTLKVGFLTVLLASPTFAQEAQKAVWSDQVPRVEGAKEYFAAPEGQEGNPGTLEAPWDLASALGGAHPVAPGDVIWVRGGTYQGKFEVRLAGPGPRPRPLHLRPEQGRRQDDLQLHHERALRRLLHDARLRV
jgi:hypothetical protein